MLVECVRVCARTHVECVEGAALELGHGKRDRVVVRVGSVTLNITRERSVSVWSLSPKEQRPRAREYVDVFVVWDLGLNLNNVVWILNRPNRPLCRCTVSDASYASIPHLS